jgi:outer membrane receptor protein involved in Fe transport
MRTRLSLALLLPILHACAVFLHAQNAPTAPPPPDEEIVMLGVFEVVDKDDTGYAATDSITGTRVATAIRDLPYNVNVVMSEFMEDFALYELPDQFAYTSSFSPDEVEGAYSLRGVPNRTQLRDGFRRGGITDRINISRAEVIKGPAAAIYGQTQPGGIINLVSRKPKAKREYHAGLSTGSYGSERIEARATGTLLSTSLGRTTYLLSAAKYKHDYEQQFRRMDQRMWAAVLAHKFTGGTSLGLEYEFVRKNMGRGTTLPFTIAGGQNDSTGRNKRTGYAYELFSFSMQGPGEYNDREVGSLGLTFDHRFGRVLSMRVGANASYRDYWRLCSVGNRFAADTRCIIFREPEYSTIFQKRRSLQVDLVAHWRSNAIEQRVLLTFDYNYFRAATIYRQTPSTYYNDPLYNVRNLSVDDPDYFLLPYDPAIYTDITQDDDNITTTHGTFQRYQIIALSDRLIGVAGARFDYIDFDLNDRHGGYASKHNTDAVSPQIGLNYKVTPRQTFFVNCSTSFTPQGSLGDRGERLENETGTGYEAGFKSLFLDGRLSVTTSIYSITKKHVKTTELEEYELRDAVGNLVLDPVTGEPVIRTDRRTRTLGTVKSEGIEVDFNYKIGESLQLIGGWGYVNPRITYAGTDLDAVGRRPARTAKMNGGVAGKYNIRSGPLKGLSLNLGFRHTGDSYAQNPTGGGTVGADGFVRDHNGGRDIRTPSYTLWEAGAGYEWRMGKFRHRVRVNLKNIFDKKYIDTSAYAGDRFGAYGTWTLRF